MKYYIYVVFIATLYISACHEKVHEEIDNTIFKITTPILRDTTVFHDYVCQIRSVRHIELRALEKGYLEKIYVDEGQYVRKGQLLFQIKPIIYAAEAQKSKAEVDYADIEFKNTKYLADSNIVSKNELALSRAKLTKAKAELDLAMAHLGFTEIRAPFDGIIGRFNEVRIGSLLDEGELLSTISDNGNMWVYFNVPETEYLNYTKLKSTTDKVNVKLQMANGEFFNQEGFIETIEADFNNETGNIAFRANFPNPNKILRHGETGKIYMPNTLHNALIIPQMATFEVLDKKYVFVVDAKGKVTSREIIVQSELPHLYVISSGLQESDQILFEGIRKVKNGSVIKYQKKAMESLLDELAHLKAE